MENTLIYKSFNELEIDKYELVKEFADLSIGEKEYYYSIIDGKQKGRIFVDNVEKINAVLFWHYSGFGFVAGNPDAAFMENVKAMIMQEHTYFRQYSNRTKKKLILQQNNDLIEKYLNGTKGIKRTERLYFVMSGKRQVIQKLSSEYEIKEIDAEILSRLIGDVVPAFSWSSNEEFLQYGKGYCIVRGDDIASWAFSAAIGAGRIDIGIETNKKYRGIGLGKVVASKMIDYTYSVDAQPVWGCGLENELSRKTAESVGFKLAGKHAKYIKEQ